MKEATGGIFSLEFIIVFLLILNGYMAFNVNYTKAFRVKVYYTRHRAGTRTTE